MSKPRPLLYRGQLLSLNYLTGITGKSKNVILGWEKRGILEVMLDQYFMKKLKGRDSMTVEVEK